MPCAPCDVHVLSLEAEPTYLARVHEATWQDADVEMKAHTHSFMLGSFMGWNLCIMD